MSDEAESSGQALERFMKEQFDALSIEVPEDDLEMMARFVEEEGLEKEEKVEGVRAMIEGFVDVRIKLFYLMWLKLMSSLYLRGLIRYWNR